MCITEKEITYTDTISSLPKKVYFRPAHVQCSCKQEYDGQDDLFNLDNEHLFCYSVLFTCLHSMLEGRNPYMYLSACERNYSIESHTKPVRIKKLHQAWNAFARLLGLKPDKAFECLLCGLEC